jgi:hypothetical protein
LKTPYQFWCALSIVLIQLKELIFQNFNDLLRIQKQEHHLVIIEDTKWNTWYALLIVLIQLKELIFQNFNDLSRIQKQEHHLVIIEDTLYNLDVHYQ